MRRRALIVVLLISSGAALIVLVASMFNFDNDLTTTNSFPTSNDLLIFNRVPKTGSTNLASLMVEISAQNGFVHKRFGNPDLRLISVPDQVRMIGQLARDDTIHQRSCNWPMDRKISLIFFFVYSAG